MCCTPTFRNSCRTAGQCVAVCCSVLQVLQCVCNTLQHHVLRTVFPQLMPHCYALQHTRCNTRTATCTASHSATHCNTHCNSQQQRFQRLPRAAHYLSATNATAGQCVAVCCSVLQVLQCVCNTLQHHVLRTIFPQLMPHCYALQHTRYNTHCNMHWYSHWNAL